MRRLCFVDLISHSRKELLHFISGVVPSLCEELFVVVREYLKCIHATVTGYSAYATTKPLVTRMCHI